MLKYFRFPLAFAAVGLALGAGLGYLHGHTLQAAAATAFICAVLGVLEVSLSLDNAIVNARVLNTMEPKWQRRFLTWGIVFAVFGMRIMFPLVIVAIAARLGPVDALTLAINDPGRYAAILEGAHVGISGFGGAFLMMVAFDYFIDSDKAVHWVAPLEKVLGRLGSIEGSQIAIALAVAIGVTYLLPAPEAMTFLRSAVFGILTYLAVRGLGNFVGAGDKAVGAVVRGGAATFLYLEVLDASFSFDGVVGAFAMSEDIFVIAIGLGIGAAFVRAMTLLLVDQGTLAEYRFLEHGAFYAILSLALIMFAQSLVPDVVTGLIGAGLIALAIVSSILWTRRHPEAVSDAVRADPAGEAAVGNEEGRGISPDPAAPAAPRV